MTKKKQKGTDLSFRPFFERIAMENKRMGLVFFPRRKDHKGLESLLGLEDPAIIDRQQEGNMIMLVLDSPERMDALINRAAEMTEGLDVHSALLTTDNKPVGMAWLTYDALARQNPIVAMSTFINEVLSKPVVPNKLKKEIGLELENLGDTYLAKASAHQRMIIPVWKEIFRSCHQEQSTRQFPPESRN